MEEHACRPAMEEVETAVVSSCPALVSIRLRAIGRTIIGHEHMNDLSLKNILDITRSSMTNRRDQKQHERRGHEKGPERRGLI